MLLGASNIRRLVGRCLIAVLAWQVLAAAGFGAEAYTLRPGDVVRFRVDAISPLNREMTVGPQGQINLPLVGWTDVAGKTIQEVEADARQRIPEAVYRERANGNELHIVVRAEEIVLEIAAFRPVYVSGEVGRPGELAFRPELTVRQAIALAGGLMPSAKNLNDEQLNRIASLKAEHGALMASYVEALVDLVSVAAELEDAAAIEEVDPAEVDITAAEAQFVTSASQQRLEALRALEAGERGYLADAVQQNGQRIAALRAQHRQEEAGVEFDSTELDRIQGLADQGAVQPSVLSDARRQWLLSSSRALSTRADIESAELRQADLQRQLERIDQENLVNMLDRHKTSRSQVERLHAQIEGTAEQLALSTAAEQTPDVDRPRVSFTIYRGDGSEVEGTQGDLQTELQPGDVIEVYQVVLPGSPGT